MQLQSEWHRWRMRSARSAARAGSAWIRRSFARGEALEESDVDLFVLLDRVSVRERNEVVDVEGRLWTETGLFLAHVVYERERFEKHRAQQRPLVTGVEREGLRIG
jgi:predicted nucleotidyltransferase